MGAIQFSIPKQFIQLIQKEFKYDFFVETGTYFGETTIWASEYFANVITIEIDHEIRQTAFFNARERNNIQFIVGDSGVELKNISSSLTGKTIYWLDGHWCQGVNKLSDECPIISELSSILAKEDDIVLIDDARFFMGVVPIPHDHDKWPRIDQILSLLKVKYPLHDVLVESDVIMCLPHHVYLFFVDAVRRNSIFSPLIRENKSETTVEFIRKGLNKISYYLKKLNSKKKVNLRESKEGLFENLDALNPFLRSLKLEMLIDVGASHGNFCSQIKKTNNGVHIFAFEPLRNAFNVLESKFKDDDSVRLYNFALGSSKGKVEFHENDYSFSSSLLKISDKHISEFPYTSKDKLIEIEVDCLDNIIQSSDIKHPMMIKVDVQGFEQEVINGGRLLFSKADYVIIEVSFSELYSNQPLFDDINQLLNNLGLVYSGNLNQLVSVKDGHVLQADAIFIRKK